MRLLIHAILSAWMALFALGHVSPSAGAADSLQCPQPTLQRVYTYGHDLISQRQVLAGTTGWTTHYYGYDGLGSVRYLTGAAGTVTDTYTYDAFGIQIGSTGSTPNRYRYTGEQWDDDLGAYYLRARYYVPGTGRFWTLDTYEGSQNDPLTLHKYLYAHGNPVNGTDPSGHDYTATSALSGSSLSSQLNIAQSTGAAKVRWELRQTYTELANDFNPRDLRRNQALGLEGEMVWVDFLREKGFRANRSRGSVSANGPDIYASRFHDGRLEIIIGEVKATSSGFAGIGSLRWSLINHYRQMSYSWLDNHASRVVDGLIELGISGIGKPELRRLLEQGEVDIYLLAALKKPAVWEIKGFRMLHVGGGDLEMSGFGHDEITNGDTRPLRSPR